MIRDTEVYERRLARRGLKGTRGFAAAAIGGGIAAGVAGGFAAAAAGLVAVTGLTMLVGK